MFIQGNPNMLRPRVFRPPFGTIYNHEHIQVVNGWFGVSQKFDAQMIYSPPQNLRHLKQFLKLSIYVTDLVILVMDWCHNFPLIFQPLYHKHLLWSITFIPLFIQHLGFNKRCDVLWFISLHLSRNTYPMTSSNPALMTYWLFPSDVKALSE